MAGAKAANRDLTEDEVSTIKSHLTVIDEVDAKGERAAETTGLLKRLTERSVDSKGEPTPYGKAVHDVGEHFVKSPAFREMTERKGARFSVSAPEFSKANLVGDLGQTQYGQVVPAALRRPVVADLFASGSMSQASLTYYTQGAVTGDFAPVAEAGTKPNIDFAFATVTETLSKLAGVTKISDEMSEDAPYIESVIRAQLLLRLALVEEAQLLNGSGTAPNLTGILNRTGVQTEASAASADNIDAIFRATTKVQTVSQLSADGVVMHPNDYQTMRLSTDANGQYFAGGPFTGAYGSGGVVEQPGLWGQRTIVTSAIPAGTVLVGAFGTAGQVFRKGGVRVEATNSNENDFVNNLVAIRAEERLALAVYIPTAFVRVTLSNL